MSEINAAFLWAQLESAREILDLRVSIWQRYHDAFADLEERGRVRRPFIPAHCEHNAHTYYLLLDSLDDRSAFISSLSAADINAVFHYVPLHASDAGRRLGRGHGSLDTTVSLSERLVRLPLWAGMSDEEVERVIQVARVALMS